MDMNSTHGGKRRGAVLAVLLTAGTFTATAPGAGAEGTRTETQVSWTSLPGDTNLPDIGLGYGVVQAGPDSGVLPRTLSAPVLLSSETMTLLGIAGLGAPEGPGR
ncbi:hypothetical protein [Streptomyces sp. WAC04114]|uniref:hypothetical protein n=1 Tax=Streptomyces sp. WAC04114 TaxID=2867961 RepID=UPI001C8CEC19|nr:hypothetical protein [Streptomyces sp. WAC04114]MBX9361031.1 hypothetical protein [Streptomyces sp. WAC04114]